MFEPKLGRGKGRLGSNEDNPIRCHFVVPQPLNRTTSPVTFTLPFPSNSAFGPRGRYTHHRSTHYRVFWSWLTQLIPRGSHSTSFECTHSSTGAQCYTLLHATRIKNNDREKEKEPTNKPTHEGTIERRKENTQHEQKTYNTGKEHTVKTMPMRRCRGNKKFHVFFPASRLGRRATYDVACLQR